MAAITLALKDLRLLAREPMGLFWIFVFPLLFALFFGTIFGGGDAGRGAMAVAVVDEDGSADARAFVARLEASKALKVTALSRDEARAAVRSGDQVGYVVIPKGFGDSSPFGGEKAPALAVGMDPARTAEAS
ncbi:MAG TPA: ABC transporter permease [Gemmataceae bacterium]|nr:ABC transporter permease [Gemmataceae bacterium]